MTKDATIREIHHRVKNNLQTVAALLRLQARRLPPTPRAADRAARRRCAGWAPSRWCTRRCRRASTRRSTSTTSSAADAGRAGGGGRPGRRRCACSRTGHVRRGCGPRTRRRWRWCSPSWCTNAVEHGLAGRRRHGRGRGRARGPRTTSRCSGRASATTATGCRRASTRPQPGWAPRSCRRWCGELRGRDRPGRRGRAAGPRSPLELHPRPSGAAPADRGRGGGTEAPTAIGRGLRIVGWCGRARCVRGSAGAASASVAALESATLVLGQAAPDAGVLTGLQRPLQAGVDDLAASADRLGLFDLRAGRARCSRSGRTARGPRPGRQRGCASPSGSCSLNRGLGSSASCVRQVRRRVVIGVFRAPAPVEWYPPDGRPCALRPREWRSRALEPTSTTVAVFQRHRSDHVRTST